MGDGKFNLKGVDSQSKVNEEKTLDLIGDKDFIQVVKTMGGEVYYKTEIYTTPFTNC